MKKIICLLACLFAGLANAGTILDIEDGFSVTDPGSFTLGWHFTVNSAVTIDGLGLWDEGSDGFSKASGYTVALWENTGGSLLTSVIVDNASTATASASPYGQWRFSDVAALNLGIGDYSVGYLHDVRDDAWRYGTTILSEPGITYIGSFENSGAVLTLPNDPSFALQDGHFGPNLRLVSSISSVPEPSTYAMMALGLLGIAGMRRRQNQA